MRHSIIAPSALVLACACASAEVRSELPRRTEISARELHAYISILASDSMRGRSTPSPELDRAAAFVAAQLRAAGLSPVGEDFITRYAINSTAYDTVSTKVAIQGGPTWRWRRSVLPRGAATPATGLSGTAVLIVGPPPYESVLQGRDLRGKIAFLLLPETRSHLGADWAALTRLLTGDRRPAALVLVTEKSDSVWNLVAGRLTAPIRELASESTPGIPIFEVGASTAEAVLGRHGITPNEAWVTPTARVLDLPELRLTATSPRVLIGAQRVVAVLEGSDPILKAKSGGCGEVGASCRSPPSQSLKSSPTSTPTWWAATPPIAYPCWGWSIPP